MWRTQARQPVCPPVCDFVLADFHEMQYRTFLQRITKQPWMSWKLNPWQPHFTLGHKSVSVPTLQIYWAAWIRFGIGDLHINSYNTSDFCKNRSNESHTLRKNVDWILHLISIFSNLSKFGTENVHKILFSGY